VSYLNEATGKNYSPDTKETVKLISGRLSEGRTFDDFKHVIEVKAAEWLHNDRMNQYLKPTTLFAQANFESYLNQKNPNGDRRAPYGRHEERDAGTGQKHQGGKWDGLIH
jgi:uncharacterized phage protein (TIGR02220 family)